MAKKGEILKTIIIFLFFLFGCSHKYADVEGRSFDEKIIDSWEELSADIIRIYEGKIRLNVRVKDFDVVRGWIKSREFYEFSSRGKEDILIPLGVVIGLGGCYYGFDYGCVQNDFWQYDEARFDRGCLISFASCGAGLVVMSVATANRRKVVKPVFGFIKIDTICVDSDSLSRQKISILVDGSDFEKEYYTDADGKIELKFDEIIPEPTGADSVLNLILRYYEMADTIKVRRL